MHRRHRLGAVLVTLGAGLWSLSLGVLGLWMIRDKHPGLTFSRGVSVGVGVASLGASQIVFSCFVADRHFPNAHRLVRTVIRSIGAATLTAGLGVLLVASLLVRV